MAERSPGTSDMDPDPGADDLSAAAGGGPSRTWSLQREWSWAFLLMFLAVLLGAAATVIGVRAVMNDVRDAASGFKAEAETLAGLRGGLSAHEQAGLGLLSGAPMDPREYIHSQQQLSDQFEQAYERLPAELNMKADLSEARRLWHENLDTHGLLADRLQPVGADRLSEAPAFTAAGALVRAQLDSIDHASRQALDSEIASGAQLELLVITARSTLFCLTAAAVLYFRGRMNKYVMQPLQRLHRGVAKLHSGDYRHRIPVVRNDESGS